MRVFVATIRFYGDILGAVHRLCFFISAPAASCGASSSLSLTRTRLASLMRLNVASSLLSPYESSYRKPVPERFRMMPGIALSKTDPRTLRGGAEAAKASPFDCCDRMLTKARLAADEIFYAPARACERTPGAWVRYTPSIVRPTLPE
jgi:hypothetical protein